MTIFADVRGKIFLSSFDTYENVDLNRGSVNDVASRLRVDAPGNRHGRTAVMLIFGQSNGTNSGDTPYVPRHHVINFNLFDGRRYVARDPLLGATEQQGNFAGRLADLLIERSVFDTVVLAPIGVGGSLIEEWTTGGGRHRRLQVAFRRAGDSGLQVTHLLWHQGESNAANHTAGDVYAGCLMNIHHAIRGYGVGAPLYVAQASVCASPPDETIRAAQRAVVDRELGILAGPDTDAIGPEDRYDGCHMTESGLKKHAQLWFDVLTR